MPRRASSAARKSLVSQAAAGDQLALGVGVGAGRDAERKVGPCAQGRAEEQRDDAGSQHAGHAAFSFA
jgi:hypothetical protein